MLRQDESPQNQDIERGYVVEKYDEGVLESLRLLVAVLNKQEKKLDILVNEANRICQPGEKLKLEKKGEREKYIFLFKKTDKKNTDQKSRIDIIKIGIYQRRPIGGEERANIFSKYEALR